ncbi:MAG: phage tail tape measure protein [Cetobacterium sp.]
MSDLEKRITAKMVLDDSGYSNTLKGINSELKNTKSEFKAASSGIEAFGRTTQNVERAQESLQRQLDLQSRKVAVYKESLERANTTLNKNAAEREKLTKAIQQEETKLESLKRTYGDNNQAVSNSERKLEELREQFNKVDSSIENNAKRIQGYESQLNKAETEMNKATSSLNKFNRELEEKSLEAAKAKLTAVSQGFESFGNAATNVGSKLTMGVTMPLAAIAVAAGHTGMEFESQMSRVKAISGATGDEFQELNDQALKLGQDTAFSAKQAAEGMENLASAGFNTNEIMEAMPGMLDLAASSGEDLASSSDIAASTLRGFGLAASEAGHVADVLAKNAAATNAAVADTGEAMKYVAPVAHATGLSLEEVTAAVGELANAGIKGSQAGTTLRGALTRLAKPTQAAANVMQDLGFKAFDTQGKMLPLNQIIGNLQKSTKNLTDQQKQQAITTIFGQEALSGMLTLVDAGPEQLNELTNSLKESDGAAKEMAETMQDNTKASIEQALGSLETAAIKLLQVAAPAIRSIADDVQNLANKFSNLSPQTQEFIIKAGLVAIAAGPVIGAIGKVSTGVGGLIKVGGKLLGGLGLITKGAGAAGAAAETVGASTVAATAGAEAAGGAFAGLGTTLAAFAIPALGVTAAVGAVAGGIYLAAKNTEVMNGSCLKSKEELGGLGNALLNLNGSYALTTEQMDKMNIKHKEWNDKVSPETQKALTKTSNDIAALNFEIESSNGLDKVVSEDQVKSFKARTDKLFSETEAKIKTKAPEVQKEMANAFKADDGTLDKNEQTLMKFFDSSQEKQINQIKGYQNQINDIYAKQMNSHKSLKESEIKTIQDLTQKMGQVNLDNTVKNNQELLAAQADFNVRMKNLDMNGLSQLLSEKAKARDKEVKISNDKYDKEIELLKLYRPQMNAEQQKACDDQINKLTSAKYKAEGIENDKYNSFLKAAKEKYPQLSDYINQENGQIMTEEQRKNKQRLDNFTSHMDGMNQITKTGYYKIRDTVSGQMENCYVEVDNKTGQITAAWKSGTYDILGNPMRPDAVIDPQLVDGSKFQPIVGSYNDKKHNVESNPVKPKVENPSNPFTSLVNDWNNTVGYILAHPIKAATNFFGGGSPDHNWTGTSHFKGGFTTLHERGEELYDLPSGTRIYNHQMSEQMVLETAKQTAQGLIDSITNNKDFNNTNDINLNLSVNLDGEVLANVTDKINGKKQRLERRMSGGRI